MHKFGKKVLGTIGSTHDPEHGLNEINGQRNQDLAEFEKRALEGKKHYHKETESEED